MKFIILFVLGLAAYAAGASPLLPRQGAQQLSNSTNTKLKNLKILIRNVIFTRTKAILTDGIQISPPKEVNEAIELAINEAGLESVVHIHGNIIEAIGNLIQKRASELAAQRAAESSFSHERLTGFGDISVIHEIEKLLSADYNKTIKHSGPSHEGIQGGLGAISIRGLNGIIRQPQKYDKDLQEILGHLFYVTPKFPISREGIVPVQPSEEGILTSAGELILKGAAKFSREILRGVFGPVPDILSNIFLARGSFRNHPNIQAAGHELILKARRDINRFIHSDANECLNAAEHSFSLLFKDYVKNGQACVATAHPHGKKIVARVQDIVLDAVKRVEDSHRDIDFCFEKYVEENRVVCLDQDVSHQIDEHRRKIEHYGQDLADYVKHFSDLNTWFDVCLVGHLGVVRREIHHIVHDFHKCLNLRPKLTNKKIISLDNLSFR